MLLLPLAMGAAQAQLRGHGGPVRALAISADGRQAISGSFDTSAIRWSLKRNVAEQVMRFHDNAVNAVAWLKDGRIVTAGADAHIAIWTPGRPRPDKVLDGHSGPIVDLALSPDGKTLASASWDHTVRLWPLDGGEPRVLSGNAQNVNGVAFSPDGSEIISAGYDATLRIWQLGRGGGVTVRNLPTPLNSVAVAPDGEIVSAGADGKVYLPLAAGRDARRSPGRAHADHLGRPLARRQAGRRRRHARLGSDHRAQIAQARAHADRPRPAGVVGGVLPRR